MVIDSARGQDAITPNSALKRPGRREGGEREEGGESEVGRKRASGRTNEHITQILAGGYRSFCILGGKEPRKSWEARMEEKLENERIGREEAKFLGLAPPLSQLFDRAARAQSGPGLIEADIGASGQVSSKLFISIIDEGGRYARTPSCSSSLPLVRRQLCHLEHHMAAAASTALYRPQACPRFTSEIIRFFRVSSLH